MRFALAASLVALLLPLTAGAQSLGGLGGISLDPFTLSATPESPAPFSQVTVSLQSSSIDLTEAILTAFVNGAQVYTGAVHSFPVTIGAAGSVTTVRATIVVGGESYTETLAIQPQDVQIIAEPISSAPPLYPGKPSVPLQGNVRLVAVASLKGPKGRTSNPSTYSYVWTVDEVEQIDSSGIGKSSIIVPSPLEYRESDVSVTVTDPNLGVSGVASLSYEAVDPTVQVYENDPLLGIRYDHALTDSYTINGSESTLYAAPFSLPISNGAPVVQWFLNGSLAQTGDSVTLRPAGSGQGSAALSLTASGDNSTSASANLSLIFGSQPSNNLFGL